VQEKRDRRRTIRLGMRILIFGASQGTGALAVRNALDKATT
jgi:hypothetical protein